MRMPESLASLVDYGIIDEALRPLMSGKEAQVYLVIAGGQECVAKVYKDAQSRTFKHRSTYTEGRKVRNSRDQRAMGKGSRHGRAQDEAAWRTAEVDMIYRLRDANVRVPRPHNFVDGVLVMELIKSADDLPAPRLGDLNALSPEEATAIFDQLLAEVVRMLCAGVVHGDLSDFNVLMAADGPVIIDFPQAVDASSNQNARKLLVRDVDNLHRFVARFAPEREALPYAQEMWDLYQRGELTPDTRLTGRHRPSERRVDTRQVLSLIGDADYDERKRRTALGLSMQRGAGQEPRPAAPSRPAEAAGRAVSASGRPAMQGTRREPGSANAQASQAERKGHDPVARREQGPANRQASQTERKDHSQVAKREVSFANRPATQGRPRDDRQVARRESSEPNRQPPPAQRRDDSQLARRDPDVVNRQAARPERRDDSQVARREPGVANRQTWGGERRPDTQVVQREQRPQSTSARPPAHTLDQAAQTNQSEAERGRLQAARRRRRKARRDAGKTSPQ
jgi:RIO kinase 1